MNRTHIDYSHDLNGRQKENHNAAKLSAVLADFGYFIMWLNDDYNGADLIALREGEEAMMIQLKSAPTISDKYEGKGLWMAFPVSKAHQSAGGVGDWCVIQHDDLVSVFYEMGYAESKSWTENGVYSQPLPTSKRLLEKLEPYCL